MSEDHDVDFTKSVEPSDDKDNEEIIDIDKDMENSKEKSHVNEEPSANTSKENSAIDEKEIKNNKIEEKDSSEANDNATLSWTLEGKQFKVSWEFPEGSVTQKDYVALCYAESSGITGVVGRVPATGCASGDIMWLLDEPNQPYEDCEQLLCFRYYNGEDDECEAESSPIQPRCKLDLKKLPLRLKEGMSRKRSGDQVSPFSYNNESFEMNSEDPRVEFVPGTSQDIKHLSENVDKCSISVLESNGNNLQQTKCDPSKSLVSHLSKESQFVNIESQSVIDCKPTSSGVKKKCPPPVDTGGGQALNGVKKKSKINSGFDYL